VAVVVNITNAKLAFLEISVRLQLSRSICKT